MTPTPLLLLAAAAVGVDTGWTPLETGGYEYIIQIPAEQLESLRAGGEFASDFPSDTGAIRSFKIVIGDGPVMNQGKELPEDARVMLKPLVDDPNNTQGSQPWRARTDDQRLGRPTEKTARTIQETQFPSRDIFSATGDDARTPPPNEGTRTGGDEALGDDLKLNYSRIDRARTESQQQPPAEKDSANGSAVAEVASEKEVVEDVDDGPAADRPASANEPETWSRSRFQWTLLVLGLIFCGGLNGYLGWLAMDFRNRYLELLRDLDTPPADEPEHSPRSHGGFDEEEQADSPVVSRRELVRTAETHVGRETYRRRDREADHLDDE